MITKRADVVPASCRAALCSETAGVGRPHGSHRIRGQVGIPPREQACALESTRTVSHDRGALAPSTLFFGWRLPTTLVFSRSSSRTAPELRPERRVIPPTGTPNMFDTIYEGTGSTPTPTVPDSPIAIFLPASAFVVFGVALTATAGELRHADQTLDCLVGLHRVAFYCRVRHPFLSASVLYGCEEVRARPLRLMDR